MTKMTNNNSAWVRLSFLRRDMIKLQGGPKTHRCQRGSYCTQLPLAGSHLLLLEVTILSKFPAELPNMSFLK